MTWINYIGVESPWGAGWRRDFVIAEHCPGCKCARSIHGNCIDSSQMPWQCSNCGAPIALYFDIPSATRGEDISCHSTNLPLPAYMAVFGPAPPLTGHNPSFIIIDDPTEPQPIEVEPSSPDKPKPIDFFAINKEFASR